MSFAVTHQYGAMKRNPPISTFPALLEELKDRPEDTEHGSVAVKHESAWFLEVSRGGYVIFENLENGGARHMRNVPDAKVIELCTRLAQGDITGVESEPWISGY